MPLSRRSFLATAAIGTAATAVLELPSRDLFAQQAPAAGPIILSNNENAYGPLPSMVAAMRDALTISNRYPDSQYDSYVRAVAAFHGVSTEQVLPGNGSTEILRIAVEAFTGPQRSLVMAHPTFEAVAEYAKARSVTVSTVPLAGNFAHDLDAMLAKARDGAGLVYICNPNNPTGTITPRSQMVGFVKALPENVYVLMDEAYHDFAVDMPDYVSFLDRPMNDPRLVVARTFSKVYGIAGLRLGYGIGSKEAIARMLRYQLLDNLNMVAVRTGVAGLADKDGAHSAARRNAVDRAEFLKQARKRGLNPIESYTNFVMMDSPVPTGKAIEFFKQRNILIGRDFHFGQRVRISLGTPPEMAQFWTTWDTLPA
jgi:histidinol-phosphate aminotransferase